MKVGKTSSYLGGTRYVIFEPHLRSCLKRIRGFSSSFEATMNHPWCNLKTMHGQPSSHLNHSLSNIGVKHNKT